MDFTKGKGARLCLQGLELRARTKAVPACLGMALVGQYLRGIHGR